MLQRRGQTFTFEMRLGDDVTLTVRDYLSALRDLEALLTDIERAIAPSAGVTWELDTSPEFRIRASVNGASAEALSEIVGDAQRGIAAVAHNEPDVPPSIDDRTRRRIRAVVSRLREIAPITVAATNRVPIVIDKESQPLKTSDRRAPLVEYSEVDGELDLISVRRHPQFVIYQHGTGHRVRCTLTDELISHVKDALGQRVVVEGMVRYRADGRPTSISDITSLQVVPPPHYRVEELRGAVPSIRQPEDAND